MIMSASPPIENLGRGVTGLVVLLVCVASLGCDGGTPAPPHVLYFDYEAETKNVVFEDFGRELQRRFAKPVDIIRWNVNIYEPVQLGNEVRDALRSSPDVVVAPASAIALAVREQTSTMPLVFCTISNPYMISLKGAKAGAGDTLTTGYSFDIRMELKQIEVLRMIDPSVQTIGLLVDNIWVTIPELSAVPVEARSSLGVDLIAFPADSSADLEKLWQRNSVMRRVDAWLVPETSLARDNTAAVIQFVRASRKPAIYGHPRMLDAGGLVALYVDPREATSRIVEMTAAILNGSRPSDLPPERPKRFALGVNAQTASEQGFVLNRAILTQADVVIPSVRSRQ